MRKFGVIATCWVAALAALFAVGCGQETVNVPSVVSTIPANGATGVLINTPISATFNMPMAAGSVNSTSFTVTANGSAVAGAVSYSGNVATFTPTALLSYSTLYTATITNAATSVGGTHLLLNFVWTFTTITPPPVVVSTIPVNGAVNVPIGQVISATFNEAMNAASLSASTFTVTSAGGAVAGTVTYSGATATFMPAANLANNRVYTATITTGAASVAGIPLAADYVWTFTTITPPPVVVSTIPVNTATGVPLAQVLSATFNEAMDCATLASPATTFMLTGPGAATVPATASCAGSRATLTPGADLTVNTVYTATITTGAKSLAGTPLAANYVWTFRTLPAPTPPTVISTVPASLAIDVPITQALSATFSVGMNPSTVNATTFTVAGRAQPRSLAL